MSIWDYAALLPTPPAQDLRITLGEGQTPLVRSRAIGPDVGFDNLYFKLESLNPTGSYKDRFAASAVSHLLADGAAICLGCSSGNTGAALSAYSAAVGIPCVLAIVDSAPEAKLLQMQVYGAKLVRLKGFGTDAAVTQEVAERLETLAASLGTTVQISAYRHSPLGMHGVQSLAHELVASGAEFSHVFCPAGAGGLTLAVARGFADTDHRPAVHCVQPVGNDTIAGRLRAGYDTAAPCECSTVISGLQVANVMDGTETLRAVRASGGMGYVVEDEFVFEVQADLARREGIFAEPAGVVALAGAIRALESGEIDSSMPVVCLVTGAGFKDDASRRRMAETSPTCDRVERFDDFERIVRETVNAR